MRDFFSPEIVIRAYREGYFPMAESNEGEIYWHSPDPRAIFPIYNLKMPRSLKQKLKKGHFEFSINEAFNEVIVCCSNRDETWINFDIIDTYTKLHELGFAHSIETWRNGVLIGGLYGVAIGGAFFGESMFNIEADGAKAAFYYLVEVLKSRGFLLLDSQYLNPFTQQLGAVDIPKDLYMSILHSAINMPCKFVG